MHRYLVVMEPTVARFSAYSPDVSGCIAAGATRAEVERAIREAIAFHLEGLRGRAGAGEGMEEDPPVAAEEAARRR